MSLPEGYLPRKGDVVILHATVRYDFDPGGSDNVSLSLSIREHDSNFVPLDKIVGLHARHWEPGDKVRIISNGQFGEVVAVSDDAVWIKREDGGDRKWFDTLHANMVAPDAPPRNLEELSRPADAIVQAPSAPQANPDDEEIKF